MEKSLTPGALYVEAGEQEARKEKEERRSQRRQQRRGTVQFDRDGDFGDEANAMEAAAAAMESVAEVPDGDDVD